MVGRSPERIHVERLGSTRVVNFRKGNIIARMKVLMGIEGVLHSPHLHCLVLRVQISVSFVQGLL